MQNHHDTLRQIPGTNGHPPSHIFEITPAPSQQPEERSSTPIQDVVGRQASSHTVVQDPAHVSETRSRPQSPILFPEHTEPTYVDTIAEPIPAPSRVQDLVAEPEPLPVPAPRPVSSAPITAVPVISAPTPEPLTEPHITEPTSTPVIITKENPVNEELYAKYNHAQMEIERLKEQVASLSELRRRARAPSDAGSTVASDIQTIVEDYPIHQEGVPLQVVVIIAFGVFITTYLFF